jgi:hypothetical protein
LSSFDFEPQRQNLVTFSESFDNAAWSLSNATVTANSTTAPDGYANADTFTADGANSSHRLFQTFSATSGSTYTASFFVKKGTADFVQIAVSSGTAFGITNFANFDILTGVVGTSGGSQTNNTITDYGNGWYRISSTITAIGTATAQVDLVIVQAANSVRLQSWTSSASVILYGAALEVGAYATSYIPTLGAAVTRGEDDCVKSSATSIIGQTEGVVFFEWEYQNVGSSGGNIVISLDGAGGDEIYFWVQPNGTYNFDVGDSGSGVVGISGSMGSFGTKKIAFAYKNNDFALYINGVLAGTDTSGTVPTCNRLYVGRYWANTSYNIASGIKQVLVFKTRLSNADLAALTA